MGNLKTIVDSNVNEIVNEIRLTLKPGVKKADVFILVEGVDDTRIYQKFFLKENVLFRSVGGRGNLRNAMQMLAILTPQVIAIRDADFAHLRGTKPEFDAMFFTDKHDIEMTMLSLPFIISMAAFFPNKPIQLAKNMADEAWICYTENQRRDHRKS